MTWTPFTLSGTTAANTDVTDSIDITSLGFSPATRAQNIRRRLLVVPKGGTLTTQVDLAHVDVN